MSAPDGHYTGGDGGAKEDVSLSVEATNKLRAKLGLKPLSTTNKDDVLKDKCGRRPCAWRRAALGRLLHPGSAAAHLATLTRQKSQTVVLRGRRGPLWFCVVAIAVLVPVRVAPSAFAVG